MVKVLIYVEFIAFLAFCILVKVTKKRKNQLSFSGKMRIFCTENKQTGQLIFPFWSLWPINEKRKMGWTGQKFQFLLPYLNFSLVLWMMPFWQNIAFLWAKCRINSDRKLSIWKSKRHTNFFLYIKLLVDLRANETKNF